MLLLPVRRNKTDANLDVGVVLRDSRIALEKAAASATA